MIGVKLSSLFNAPPVLTDVNGHGDLDVVFFVEKKLYIYYADKENPLPSVEEVALSTLSLNQETHVDARQYAHYLEGDLNGDSPERDSSL
ncbi:VCBS repeat-containing protein [Candidatus Williamhamiltonella defendens]|uniref:VCBS repeat-containing protein n=1 Tax=Candidatus Williamhamiltonella defendens TaxID=138072 RepID=UPI00130E50DD|nr:VCBS repeat-containing protein [Candidatus Hamiltonella defensa]